MRDRVFKNGNLTILFHVETQAVDGQVRILRRLVVVSKGVSPSTESELAGYVDGYGEKGRFLAPSGPAPLPPSSLACGPCLAIPLLRHSDRIIATFPAHSHREVTVGFASLGGCVCGAFAHEFAWGAVTV
jgi:hypothetical protein